MFCNAERRRARGRAGTEISGWLNASGARSKSNSTAGSRRPCPPGRNGRAVDGATAHWTYDGGEVWLTGNWPLEIAEDGVTVVCRCAMETGDRLFSVLSNSRPSAPVSGHIRYRINQAVTSAAMVRSARTSGCIGPWSSGAP
ncbi:MAG: hypothetical protein R3A46_09755 [Thermomicrobiales bacterium]